MVHRIELILQTQNLAVSQFADKIGIQRSGLSHILAGRNKPSLDFVMKVLQVFPELNSQWLLFGKGKMYDKNTGDREEDTQEFVPPTLEEEGLFFSPLENDSSFLQEKEILSKIPSSIEKTASLQRIILFYDNGRFEEYQN